MPVDLEAARWGIRLLLGEEPKSEEEVRFHAAGHESIDAFRSSFMQTREAKALFRKANVDLSSYSMPTFLLRPPSEKNLPHVFSPPDLNAPVSQLCTAEQMRSAEYAKISPKVGVHDQSFHRKLWEYVYIYQVLLLKGKLKEGSAGVGFGTGLEPLPSAFAKLGVRVTATDAPAELSQATDWAAGNQWTQDIKDLWFPEIVDFATFESKVSFQTADMMDIPKSLKGYDFCWSACCLEHLGSIENGLNFIRNSLDTLKSGGVAVHTTEFNLQSNEITLDEPPTCLFRKRDLESLASRLTSEGHEVAPLNFWPGADPVDEHIDVPPYSLPHLKLQVAGFLTTSIGFIVTKKSA